MLACSLAALLEQLKGLNEEQLHRIGLLQPAMTNPSLGATVEVYKSRESFDRREHVK